MNRLVFHFAFISAFQINKGVITLAKPGEKKKKPIFTSLEINTAFSHRSSNQAASCWSVWWIHVTNLNMSTICIWNFFALKQNVWSCRFLCKMLPSNSKYDRTLMLYNFETPDYISYLIEYLRQEVRLVFDEGKESGYDGKNTGQNERISCLIVYNHLQQLHALVYGKFLQGWKKKSQW